MNFKAHATVLFSQRPIPNWSIESVHPTMETKDVHASTQQDSKLNTAAKLVPVTEAQEQANFISNANQSHLILQSCQPSHAYDASRLRKDQHVADLGRECMGLHYINGYDFSRRGNLFLIEDNRVLYASSAAVILENIISGLREFVLALDEGGIGAVTVHPAKYVPVSPQEKNKAVSYYCLFSLSETTLLWVAKVSSQVYTSTHILNSRYKVYYLFLSAISHSHNLFLLGIFRFIRYFAEVQNEDMLA